MNALLLHFIRVSRLACDARQGALRYPFGRKAGFGRRIVERRPGRLFRWRKSSQAGRSRNDFMSPGGALLRNTGPTVQFLNGFAFQNGVFGLSISGSVLGALSCQSTSGAGLFAS